MGVLSKCVTTDDIVPGDHIYSWRKGRMYTHHGIYCGDNKVIHYTRGQGQETGKVCLDVLDASTMPHSAAESCPDCGMSSASGGVVISCLKCFLDNGRLYLFKYEVKTLAFLTKVRGGTCTLASSDPADAVLHRANYLLNSNSGFGCYHIFQNNCEDFAIYCKTELVVVGKNFMGCGGQAAAVFGAPLAAVIATPLSIMMTNPCLAAAAAGGLYVFWRYSNDIGMRKNVEKVAVELIRIAPCSRVGSGSCPRWVARIHLKMRRRIGQTLAKAFLKMQEGSRPRARIAR